jgi:hypothetical protein
MATEGQSGGKQIARLKTGDKTRTARHADVMNEIIDALNALQNMTVSPTGTGKFIYSDANAVLDLTNALIPLDLHVCIEGEEKVVTFYVKGAPRNP